MATTLEFAPSTSHIKIDLFPARVHNGVYGAENNDVLFIESRTIVTNDYMYVILMGDTGPYFALQEEIVDFEMIPRVGYQVTGAHNEYFLDVDGNCGCGSRLRGIRLLPGVGHIALNTAIKKR